MDGFTETPEYRAVRHLTSAIDREVIAAEALQRGRDGEGKARLALLTKMQAVLLREATRLAQSASDPPPG